MVRIHVSVKSQGVSKTIHSFAGSPQVHGFYSAAGGMGFVDTYMYFILLRRLGCTLSGRHLKINITKAQLRLAKTGQAFALIFSRSCGERSCVGRVGIGMEGEGVEMERRARASITRAKTKITIWKGEGLVSLYVIWRRRMGKRCEGSHGFHGSVPADSRFLVCLCQRQRSRLLGRRRRCRMGLLFRCS